MDTQPILDPGPSGDGIHLEDGFYTIEGQHVDFSSHPTSEIDECIGMTRGAYGIVRDCIFEGAEKIALLGSGDEEFRSLEEGKAIVFDNCIFRNGSRRMPEVQCGMHCLMINCTIEDWAEPSRQPRDPRKARGFGAWAHDGGHIIAINCHFKQKRLWKGLLNMASDILGHLGNAINDEGPSAIFHLKSWIPGSLRGLTESDDGTVVAINCTKSHPLILIENDCHVDDVEGFLNLDMNQFIKSPFDLTSKAMSLTMHC